MECGYMADISILKFHSHRSECNIRNKKENHYRAKAVVKEIFAYPWKYPFQKYF